MKNSRSASSQVAVNSSPQQPENLTKGILRQVLTDFLVQASSAAADHLCPNCGNPMEHVTTTFTLYGSDTSWQVRLPVCSCGAKARDLQPIHRAAS